MSYDRYDEVGRRGGGQADEYYGGGEESRGFGGRQDEYGQGSGGYGVEHRRRDEGFGQERSGGGGDEYGSQPGGFREPRRHHQQEGGFGGDDQYSSGGGGYSEPRGHHQEGGRFGGLGGGKDYESGQYGYEGRHQGGRRFEEQGSSYGMAPEGGMADYQGEGHTEAISHALKHSGGEDSSMFASAMSMLGQNKHSFQNEPLDEQMMTGAHQQLYGGQGSNRPHDSDSLGAGAAMQAMKMFTGGGAGQGGMGSMGGGNSQNQLIGLAMANASKLFDQQQSQGNVASGANKQSAVESAAKMALKMYLSSGQGGGGGAGGLIGKLL